MAFVAVDFETTGLDLDKLAPIEVGFAYREQGIIQSRGVLLDPQCFFTFDVESLAVNQINPFDVFDYGQEIPWVDLDLAGGNFFKLGNHIPVGWNVGSFDMIIARKWMPNFAKCFHPYRSCDLNSILFSQSYDDDHFKQLKARLNDLVKAKMPSEDENSNFKEHRARYDAVKVLISFEIMREAFLVGTFDEK